MEIPVGFAQLNYIFEGTAAPQGAQVTIGLDPVSSDPIDVAELAFNLWVTHLKGNTSANLNLVGTLVKMGPNESGNFHLRSSIEPGGVGGDCDPPNTAFLIKKVTAIGGRRGRGRLFYPGVFSANTSNGGLIDGGTLSAIQADWDDWQAGAVSASIPPVLLHADSTPPTPILSFDVQQKVATQRRRLR
jgi:hypothetical protein